MKKQQATINPNSRTSQILAHMRVNKHGISPMESIVVFGVYRLASVVHRLRERGHNIITEMREDAHGKTYARYKLVRG